MDGSENLSDYQSAVEKHSTPIDSTPKNIHKTLQTFEDVENKNRIPDDEELKREFNERWDKPIHADVRIKLSDFKLFKTLGKGSFGRVILAKHRIRTDETFAMKILDKRKVYEKNQVKHVMNEKRILWAIQHPNIVQLKICFKDNSNLYLGLECMPHGNLYTQLKYRNSFTENESKFLSAQVFLALDYLHKNDTIYRDLKPENILINSDGYIKLTDFGFAKRLQNRTFTVCGTPDYLSPEIIQSKPYGKSVDWWAFGILLYELNTGFSPFRASNIKELCEKICTEDPVVPSQLSEELNELITGLLQRNVSKRYGCMKDGSKQIQYSKWFMTTNFSDIFLKKVVPPIKFDFRIPKMKHQEEAVEISITNFMEEEFEEF